MHEYSYTNIWKKLLKPDIVSLLISIHEYRGKETLYIEAKKDSLSQLLEIAKIQSTDASNRIENIYTSDEQLKKIVLNKTMPVTRNEKEIAGYRDVLQTIHENYDYIPFKSSSFLQLHRDLYKFSGGSIGGKYKVSDNEISEIDDQGNKRTRFEPVKAWLTSESIDQLCQSYESIIKEKDVDPLLLIPVVILDFLCIHPFSDGNGRMSRLLTLLLLYRSGYYVGKYISIERLIIDSKETYYETLQESSIGWHDSENDYLPFVRYLLGIILAAYREFESRVDLLSNQGLSKPEIVEQFIKKSIGKTTYAEIKEGCPDVSHTTIQRTLKDLVDKNKIIKIGGGRYTSYVWNQEDE